MWLLAAASLFMVHGAPLDMPRASATQHIVLAVPRKEQDPQPGDDKGGWI